LTHTVDEVSDLLDVPRPTLYRYLREYSIPHLRRSGKIYIPEESFERIKEVRELHKEGLGTESVRRRLRGESNVEGIEGRLDRISEVLEGWQGNPKPANGASYAYILQTILARQNLLISEVSNLTGMLEDLTHANGRHLEKASSDPEEESQEQEIFFEQPEEHPETTENDPTADELVTGTSPGPTASLAAPARRRRKFGAMARRRRRGALAILLLALLTSIALAALALNGERAPRVFQEETSAPAQEAPPSGSEEVSTGAQDTTTPSDSAAHTQKEPEEYSGDGYEDHPRQQPSYQPQYAAPQPFPQEQYAPSQFDDQNVPIVNAPIPVERGMAPQ
jgi:DNA-binding transcriptional MerR regulator